MVFIQVDLKNEEISKEIDIIQIRQNFASKGEATNFVLEEWYNQNIKREKKENARTNTKK